MCIRGGREELALIPKINPGNPVPGRGGAYFLKTRPRQTLISHVVGWERQRATGPRTGTENLYHSNSLT